MLESHLFHSDPVCLRHGKSMAALLGVCHRTSLSSSSFLPATTASEFDIRFTTGECLSSSYHALSGQWSAQCGAAGDQAARMLETRPRAISLNGTHMPIAQPMMPTTHKNGVTSSDLVPRILLAQCLRSSGRIQVFVQAMPQNILAVG